MCVRRARCGYVCKGYLCVAYEFFPQGLSLMSLGKLVPSEGVYRDILKRNPLSGCAHFGLAGLFNREGSPEKVIFDVMICISIIITVLAR